jgi:hypothetical protein
VRALSDVCELVSRVYMGQFSEIADIQPGMRVEEKDIPRLHQVQRMLDEVKMVALPELVYKNAYHSISSPAIPDEARVLYGLHCVLRHRLAWDRHPEGGMQVTFDTPRQLSREVPLATIERLP